MKVKYSFISSFSGVTELPDAKNDLHAIYAATRFCVMNHETLMSVWKQEGDAEAQMIVEPGEFDERKETFEKNFK